MVTCPGCGHQNPASARFCGGCGARLERLCAACQASNPPDNHFCHECGAALRPGSAAEVFTSPRAYTPRHLAEKILTIGGALAGERKQVTVLFVDVSGFTSLSERLDPEEVHRLTSRAFDLILAEVHRYEGTVNQFLGDGIMALFGYLNTIGWLRIECGDLDEGIALSERSYEVIGRSSSAGHGTGAERRAFVRNNEADAFMARGDLASAADALDESHHIVQHPPPSRWMTWRYTIHCQAGRQRTQDRALRAGLESSPLVREVEDLARR